MNCGANLSLNSHRHWSAADKSEQISESVATSLTRFLEFVIQKKKKHINLHSHPMMLVHQPERGAPASHFLSESEQRRRFKFLLIKMIDSMWEKKSEKEWSGTCKWHKDRNQSVSMLTQEEAPSMPSWVWDETWFSGWLEEGTGGGTVGWRILSCRW